MGASPLTWKVTKSLVELASHFSACPHAASVSRQPNQSKAQTQKAAKAVSPPIMVTNSSSRLVPPRPAAASVGPSRRADGGENGVVLAPRLLLGTQFLECRTFQPVEVTLARSRLRR